MSTKVTFFKANGELSRDLVSKFSISEINLHEKGTEFIISPSEETVVFTESNVCEIIPIVISKKTEYVYYCHPCTKENIILMASIVEEKNKLTKYTILSTREIISEEIVVPTEPNIVYIFSDENRIIILSEKNLNQFRLYKLNTSLDESTIFLGHSNQILAIDVSEDENLIVSSGRDKYLKIWDPNSGLCIQNFRLPLYCGKVAFLNSTRIIAWEGTPDLFIWDYNENQLKFKLTNIYPVVVKQINIDFNHYLLVGKEDGTLDCYLANDGQLLWSTLLHNRWVYSLGFHYFSSSIITAGGDAKVCLVDAKSGELKQTLLGHKAGVYNIITTQNTIITSGLDETIRIWNIETGKCIAILAGHLHRIQEMFFTSNKKFLISKDRLGYTVAWDLGSG